MDIITLKEVVEAVNGKVEVKGNIEEFYNVSTDTRKINNGDIFIALKGENFNANNYVVEASQKGAALCIVDEINFSEVELKSHTTIVLVENTRRALLNLAKYYRNKLNIKVIGVTGSTGKTSTKDLIAAVLSSKYKVFKTKGNFNNEIGLPLMIFNLDSTYDVAVLEMGMSDLGEIHRLAEVATPDIAVVTNIGLSHIENLKTRENILKAKMEITDFFNENNVLILNGENDLLENVENCKYKIMKTGLKNGFNFIGNDIIIEEEYIEFNVKENDKVIPERIKAYIPGKHNVLNSLLAIACGRVMGMNYSDIKDGIKNLEATSMRLDIIKGEKFTIINDCYNASPDSMEAALDVLSHMKGNKKIAILGTMKELGQESYNAHKGVGEYARNKKIDLLITLGEFNEAFEIGFNSRVACNSSEELKNNEEHKCERCNTFKSFNNYDEVLAYLSDYINKEDVILVKASRSMKFENIVSELQKLTN